MSEVYNLNKKALASNFEDREYHNLVEKYTQLVHKHTQTQMKLDGIRIYSESLRSDIDELRSRISKLDDNLRNELGLNSILFGLEHDTILIEKEVREWFSSLSEENPQSQ